MGFKGWGNVPGLNVTNANGFSNLQTPVQTQSKNKKVKNATKQTYDGIVFDSKLEMLAYQQLKGLGFEFNMKDVIELVSSFMFNGKLVKGITMEPDFNLDVNGVHIIIETKGNPNDVYPYKLKLLKQKIAKQNYVYQYGDTGTTIILFIHLQKQLDDFFAALHSFKQTNNRQILKYLIDTYSHYESEATVKRRKKKSKEYRERKKIEKNGGITV